VIGGRFFPPVLPGEGGSGTTTGRRPLRGNDRPIPGRRGRRRRRRRPLRRCASLPRTPARTRASSRGGHPGPPQAAPRADFRGLLSRGRGIEDRLHLRAGEESRKFILPPAGQCVPLRRGNGRFPAAKSRAVATAREREAEDGTNSSAHPSDTAVAPSTGSPLTQISAALDGPISRGRRCIPPYPG